MRHGKYQHCIDACVDCGTKCEHCAAACSRETDAHLLAKCIQLDKECAEMCFGAARIMELGSEHAADICRLCAEFCNRCADECEKHSHMEHCRTCAEACRKCAKDCQEMAAQEANLVFTISDVN